MQRSDDQAARGNFKPAGFDDLNGTMLPEADRRFADPSHLLLDKRPPATDNRVVRTHRTADGRALPSCRRGSAHAVDNRADASDAATG
jgi:hypothetical protein